METVPGEIASHSLTTRCGKKSSALVRAVAKPGKIRPRIRSSRYLTNFRGAPDGTVPKLKLISSAESAGTMELDLTTRYLRLALAASDKRKAMRLAAVSDLSATGILWN